MSENDVSTPVVCETCGRGAQYGWTCSSGFHMCHACTWRSGERVTTCAGCQKMEAQTPPAQPSGVTRYVVLCDLELPRQDNVTRILSDLPNIRWWRYIPNSWVVVDLQGRDARWWRDFVLRAGAPEFTRDIRSRIVVLCATDDDWSAVLPLSEADWMHTVWKPKDATKDPRCRCGVPELATAHRRDCPAFPAETIPSKEEA